MQAKFCAMDPLEIICIYEALEEDKNRRSWVHPLNTKRLTHGQFHVLYEELCKHPDKFSQYYRMSINSFQELLQLIKRYITKSDTHMRPAISPEERLTITIRYLATGINFNSLSKEFLIGRSTLCEIVRETCIQLWNVLQPQEMPEPNKKNWLAKSELFHKKTNFPNCVGALDGKHIRLKTPAHSGSNFVNYKKYFSIVLLAAADANCFFTAIHVSNSGKESDSTVFKNSTLGRKIYRNELDLPRDRNLPNYSGTPQPYVFVGDESFALHRNIMRPYPNRNLYRNKRIFNYRLSRARRCVECAFGILTSKWRVLHTAMLVEPDFAVDVVKATCVLHNFVRRKCGGDFDDELLTTSLQSLQPTVSTRSPSSIATRDFFKNYFVSETGALPWQDRVSLVF